MFLWNVYTLNFFNKKFTGAAPPDTPDPALIPSNAYSNTNSNKQQILENYNKLIKTNKYPIQSSAGPPVVGIDVSESLQCQCKCAQSFSTNLIISSTTANNFTAENCLYSCYSEAIYLNEDRQFLTNWLTVWLVF